MKLFVLPAAFGRCWSRAGLCQRAQSEHRAGSDPLTALSLDRHSQTWSKTWRLILRPQGHPLAQSQEPLPARKLLGLAGRLQRVSVRPVFPLTTHTRERETELLGWFFLPYVLLRLRCSEVREGPGSSTSVYHGCGWLGPVLVHTGVWCRCRGVGEAVRAKK